MKKTKVIEFFGEPLNYGGQEAYILNVYSKINKDKFEFTFITPFECTNIILKEMISNNGDHLIVDNQKFESKLRKKYILNTSKKHLNNEYDIIHIHSGSIFTLYNVSKIAKQKNIKKVVVHSHATGYDDLKHKISHFIFSHKLLKYVDKYLACSKAAASYKYSKQIIESNKYIVAYNGIDMDKYKFDKDIRNKYRKKLNVLNNKVICHVGRFSNEKNQKYAIDILNELLKMDDSYMLILIGNGENEAKLKLYVDNLKIQNKVLFLGNRNDVNAILMASDIFVFPSLFEGLGMSAIEAQATLMPTICSTVVPEETNITKYFHKISVNDSPKVWANYIKKISKLDTRLGNEFNGNYYNYDIAKSSQIIEDVYNENIK